MRHNFKISGLQRLKVHTESRGESGFDLFARSCPSFQLIPPVSIAGQMKIIKKNKKKSMSQLEGKSHDSGKELCRCPSQQRRPSHPDVLASLRRPAVLSASGALGATHSSRLFSQVADVSTSTGMHSSCPSFAHATNGCLAVSKIRSPSLSPPTPLFSL